MNNNEIKQYIEEIEGLPPVSADEEKELIKEILGGDAKSKDRLAQAYLMYVVNTAKEYSKFTSISSLYDLIMEGNVALLKAIDNLDCHVTNHQEYITAEIRIAIKRLAFTIFETPRIISDKLDNHE